MPIENIHEGDEVLSRNRETGKDEYQTVAALIPRHQDTVLEMHIEGEQTPLRPSTSHPFWVERGGALPQWIAAGEMRTGDFVQSMQGAWRRVVSITPVEGQETVYNFTVDLNHDYFVGETGFLVHNANPLDCECNNKEEALQEALQRWGGDPDNYEEIPTWGKNPNLTGPNGEPYSIVQALTEDGEGIVEFDHHSNGHFFSDTGESRGPHYHGPKGEHICYPK